MFSGCTSYEECLTVPCCPLFLSGTVMKNCFSFRLQQHHILCFLFFHYLVTIFHRWDWVFQDQLSGLQCPSLTPCVFFLWIWAREERHWSKRRTLNELDKRFEITLLLFLSAYQRRMLSLCLSGCTKCLCMDFKMEQELCQYNILFRKYIHLTLCFYFPVFLYFNILL